MTSMMNRRIFIVTAAGLLATPLAGEGQPQPKVFRIAAVSAGAPRSSPHWVTFGQRLTELGYVEGRNISIEFRSADGKPERFPKLMSELVRLGVNVIVAVGPEASLSAAQAAELVVNLQTAKALGLTIPPSVLARADEIIHP